MKQKILRLPDNTADDFEKFAAQKGSSENQVAEDALKHFMECTKVEKNQGMRLIPLKFKGICTLCGHEVQQGQWAWWAPGSGIICTDCEIKKYGDKGTARKYLKVKELEFTRQALENECDKLATRFRELSLLEILDTMYTKNTDVQKLLADYLKQNFTKPEDEKQALEAAKKSVEELFQVIHEIREYMTQPYKKKKKDWKEVPQEA